MAKLLPENKGWQNSFKQNLPFVLLTAIIFLLEARPLVMQGMFFDGVVYFSVALNMAHGLGTWWRPYWNPFFPLFFEHPAGGMILQSLLFRLLHSDSIFVDKLYSFILVIANLAAVMLMWRKTLPAAKACFSWLPILIWLLLFNNS